VMLASFRPLMHRTEPHEADDPRFLEKEATAREAMPVIAGHFATLERGLSGKPYLCGAFSAADIAVFMAVFWVRRLGGPSLKAHPSLAAWYTRLSDRPAFAGVIAEILQ